MNTVETVSSVTIINTGSGYEPHDVLVERVARAVLTAIQTSGGIFCGTTPPFDELPDEFKSGVLASVSRAALAEIFKSPQSAGAGPYDCPPFNTLWSNSLHDQVEPFSWQGGYVWVRWGQKRETRLWAYDEFWDWAIKTGANVREVAE